MQPPRIATSLLLLALTPPAATAQSPADVVRTASELGAMLGAEAGCGLAYDQAAIDAFIDAEVPPDAMEFPGYLTLMTDNAASTVAAMSDRDRATHCHAVERTARHFGFID